MSRLDFVCVGAQKAGTSALDAMLRQHPHLGLPVVKETKFFLDEQTSEHSRGASYYFKKYFAELNNSGSNLMLGEVDPEYAYFPAVARRLAEHNPALKIIFILRDPVERAYSHYKMNLQRGIEDLSFGKAIANEESRTGTFCGALNYSYKSRGLYCQQIERFVGLFGRSQVHVMIFERLCMQPSASMAELYGFLGVDPIVHDDVPRTNVTVQPKVAALSKLLYGDAFIKRVLRPLVPSDLLRRKIGSTVERINSSGRPLSVSAMDDSLRRALNSFYRDINEDLAKYVDPVHLLSWGSNE